MILEEHSRKYYSNKKPKKCQKSILYLCVIFPPSLPPSLRPPHHIFTLGTKLNQVANAYCF